LSDTLYERFIAASGTTDAVYGARFFAQTITVGNTGANEKHLITSVKLLLRRVGSPGWFTIGIRAVDPVTGFPTGPNLTTGTMNGDTLLLFSTLTEVTITPYKLILGGRYAITIECPDCPGGGDILEVFRGNVSGYGGGSWCYSTDSGATWGTNLGRDYTFYEYGTQILARFTAEQSNETKLSGTQENL